MIHSIQGEIVMKKRRRMLFLIAPIMMLASCSSEGESVTANEKMYISSVQKGSL